MIKQNLLKVITLAGSSAALAAGVVGAIALETACSSGGGGGGGGSSTAGTSSGSSSGATASSSGAGTSSGTGSSSGGAGSQVPLVPSATGYVQVGSLNITGAWYGYGDMWGTAGMPPGNCQAAGFSSTQCSMITFPPADMAVTSDAGEAGVVGLFPPAGADAAAPGAMCLSGTAAKVIDKSGTTSPDYSDIFGIGIGLDFNNVGGDKMNYDAMGNGVVGFTFQITGVPTGGIRVEFPTSDTVATGQDSWAIDVTHDGTYTAMLATTGANKLSPSFTASGFTQPAFNPSHLQSIQFHVATNTAGAIPVSDMCVSNLSAITSM